MSLLSEALLRLNVNMDGMRNDVKQANDDLRMLFSPEMNSYIHSVYNDPLKSIRDRKKKKAIKK